MNRIRELRTQRDWLQKELASRMKVSVVTISRYELGQRQLEPDAICRLCDIFEVTADYLLGRSDSPNPSVSDSDAALISAYHAADDNIRKAIDALLFPASEPEGKSEAS